MSLGHFTRDSAETVNLRGSDQPVGSVNWADLQGVDPTSPERASSFSSSFENPNNAGNYDCETYPAVIIIPYTLHGM